MRSLRDATACGWRVQHMRGVIRTLSLSVRWPDPISELFVCGSMHTQQGRTRAFRRVQPAEAKCCS